MRQFLHLESNRKILCRFEGNRVVLMPVRSSTENLYGILKTAKKAPTPAQLRKARTDYAAKKYGR